MRDDKQSRKKPGPVAGPETMRTTVMIDPELVEWGKQQPGGLSELIRRLLRQAYNADGAVIAESETAYTTGSEK